VLSIISKESFFQEAVELVSAGFSFCFFVFFLLYVRWVRLKVTFFIVSLYLNVYEQLRIRWEFPAAFMLYKRRALCRTVI